MDTTIKRLWMVVARRYINLCSGIPVALGAGIWFDIIEPEAWHAPVIGGCIWGLWRFLVKLKPDTRSPPDPPEPKAADRVKPNGISARLAAALQVLFDGWL